MVGTIEQVRRLRAMKLRATLFLVGAAVVFIATFSMGDATWIGLPTGGQ